MFPIVISPLQTTDEVEIVERKGVGHPDTICDALAEALSRNLCQEYQRRFGEILHHNVDMALLCGGHTAAAFGGGSIIMPINIYLAGRAIAEVGGETIPIKEIAVEGSRAWLKANLHALDPDHQVRIDALVQHTYASIPAVRQNRSKLTETASQALPTAPIPVGGEAINGVLTFSMALLSFVDSTPRAYRLKASNAAPPISTFPGAIARAVQCRLCG